MKTILRAFLINSGALWLTSRILPGLIITGGVKGLLIGSLAFMLTDLLLVPLIKILFLPLNLLTVGLFAWVSNVLALYFLVTTVPIFQLTSYPFAGAEINGFIIPAMNLSPFQVAMVSSFIIGALIHFMNWLIK